MEAALQHPERICGLFWLNAPLRVWVRPRAVGSAFRVIFNRIPPGDNAARAMQRAYGVRPDACVFKYLRWVPNYLALFRLIHQSRRRCRQVRVPCLCFQSGRDELVARSGAKYLADNPCIAVHCSNVRAISGMRIKKRRGSVRGSRRFAAAAEPLCTEKRLFFCGDTRKFNNLGGKKFAGLYGLWQKISYHIKIWNLRRRRVCCRPAGCDRRLDTWNGGICWMKTDARPESAWCAGNRSVPAGTTGWCMSG